MARTEQAIRVLDGVTPDAIPFDDLLEANQPTILKGLASSWELVQAGRESAEEAMAVLERYSVGAPVGYFVAPPEVEARFSYNKECTGFNYETRSAPPADIFAQIRANGAASEHPYLYVQSLVLDENFPGLRAQNDLAFDHAAFHSNPPLSKIWIGSESIASAHYDVPNNIACCVVGRRRFTLFPPEQIHNLYPGPLDATPGGQVVTMVDLKNPDFERFPRVRDALSAAVVADLEPGDALFYPIMWWHHVEAMDPFNVMINYWWLSAPAYMGNPLDIVMHGILGLRDRPESEKQAWREVFDYYVFGSADTPRKHLPDAVHGSLADVDDMNARRLRARLKAALNR
ncbi:MAG: cupin-like domain-containing protein [Pseudomonadota bacterium]